MPHFCNIYYCIKEKEESPERYVRRLLEHGFADSFSMSYNEGVVKKGSFGKPYYNKNGVYYNLSHGHYIVALACANVEVGIDVESERNVRENTMRKSCTQTELDWLKNSKNPTVDFLRLWTLKESYVKMTGTGFRMPPYEVEFLLESDKKITSNKEAVFFQYELKEGMMALCLKKDNYIWKKNEIRINRIDDKAENR